MGQIYQITPFSQLDYPDELSCIVWFSGCNLRCAYCHNPDIVKSKGEKEDAELIDFLKKRQGRLTAVVFSGGEATFCPTLPSLMGQTKELGFKTKLDTNGANPSVLRDLVMAGKINRVALDYKCPPHMAETILGSARFQPAFYESLDFLIKAERDGLVELEVRTTIPLDMMGDDDINWMIADLEKRGYRGTYWLQNVVSTG